MNWVISPLTDEKLLMYFVLPIGFPRFPLSGIRLCYWLWNVALLPRWETGDRRSSIHQPPLSLPPACLLFSTSVPFCLPLFLILLVWQNKHGFLCSFHQTEPNKHQSCLSWVNAVLGGHRKQGACVGKLPSDWHADPAGGVGLTTASGGHNTFSLALIKIAGLVSPPVLCAVRHTVSRIIMLAARNPPDTVSCCSLSVWLMGNWKYSAEPAARLFTDVVLSVLFVWVRGKWGGEIIITE